MRENLIQEGRRGSDGRSYIDGDWYGLGIPGNVTTAGDAYIDTSYGFAAFHSQLEEGMYLGEASGCYDRATFVTGPSGYIGVGRYVILNGVTLVSQRSILIGDHCMLAWGSVLTDSILDGRETCVAARRAALLAAAQDPSRRLPCFGEPAPVVLEDNCWVGFDAVILPGVRLGRGCLIGGKTVVYTDVPPYAVVAGNPARIIRYLDPDDTEAARQKAFSEYKINPRQT
jgi:acetyltransferase-like isoleucine patch superfamily enzyme